MFGMNRAEVLFDKATRFVSFASFITKNDKEDKQIFTWATFSPILIPVLVPWKYLAELLSCNNPAETNKVHKKRETFVNPLVLHILRFFRFADAAFLLHAIIYSDEWCKGKCTKNLGFALCLFVCLHGGKIKTLCMAFML